MSRFIKYSGLLALLTLACNFFLSPESEIPIQDPTATVSIKAAADTLQPDDTPTAATATTEPATVTPASQETDTSAPTTPTMNPPTPTSPPAFVIPGSLAALHKENAADLQPVAQLPGDSTTQIAFSPLNRLLAIGLSDGTVEIWDLDSGSLMMVGIGHETGQQVHHLDFSADGQFLLSATSGANEKAAIIWEVSSGAIVATFDNSPAWLMPDGKHLALATGVTKSSIEIIDFTTGELSNIFTDPSGLYLVEINLSPDGTILVGSTAGANLAATTLYRVEDGEIVAALEDVLRLAFSPRGDLAAGSLADQPQMRLFDPETWEIVGDLSGPEALKFSSPAFSHDGQMVAGAFGSAIILFDTASRQVVASLPASSVHDIAFSPDGQLMATYTFRGSTHLWGAVSDRG